MTESHVASAVFDSAVGPLFARAVAGNLTELSFVSDRHGRLLDDPHHHVEDGESRGIVAAAERQLREYFEGRRKDFDFPVRLQGAPFQQRVWEALRAIPYGETASYGDIARRVGDPDAARAVGAANAANPVVIIVPCHRVIGANGDLVGYGGGLHRKRVLLDLESGRCALGFTDR